ncbi:MAG: RNA methyltransferase [Firmicutes bacterium]|nr:RNA methyltransferase [Bacillota bacterium]
MKTISSKDNQIVKETASLREKKYRDTLGQYIVEGPNLVRELIEYGGRIRFIFLKAGAGAEARQIARDADGLTAVYELTEDLFSKIDSDISTQGIVAVAWKPSYDRDTFFRAVGERNVIVFDRLQDPGNVGTLMRTAEAMGFGGAVLIKGTADPFQPKAVRAAAGSILRFPYIFCDSGAEAGSMLRAAGKKLYAAFMEGSVCVTDADLRENAAIILGNEGNGVSDELAAVSEKLYIPMDGGTESLNAAAAGTIIMYEAKRQKSE